MHPLNILVKKTLCSEQHAVIFFFKTSVIDLIQWDDIECSARLKVIDANNATCILNNCLPILFIKIFLGLGDDIFPKKNDG